MLWWKRIWRQPMNLFMFSVFHIAAASIYWLVSREDATLFDGSWLTFHKVLTNFLLFSVLSNLWALILSDPTPRKIIFTENDHIEKGWDVCNTCEAYRPHRAYHCLTCRVCVLKRDHHCYFAGNCVGYSNARYFYSLLFSTLLSLAYTNLISLEYLIKTTLLNPLQVLLSFFAPIPAAIAGFLHEDFVVLFVSTISLIALGYTCYLVLLHSGSVASGITLTEKNREKESYKERYRIGILENIREIYGSNWPIAWISPLIPSPQRSNGAHFPHPKTRRASRFSSLRK